MKEVVIELDPETLEFSSNQLGFKGKGCSLIVELLTQGNELIKDTKKPEYNAKGQICLTA